jgi:hypothetical protein
MAEDQKKHVIILGAGASATSGYPQADGLRLLMSSEPVLREELEKRTNCNKERIDQIINWAMRGERAATIELFRHGGFATVDEFSKLASDKLHFKVQDLKRLLRFALSLHNPEDEFHKSDYYKFIQRLFLPDLVSPRSDVAILTFNYDPYLPYLLQKAYEKRQLAASPGYTRLPNQIDAIMKGIGFYDPGAIETDDGLCLLQLHGLIAWPGIGPGEGVDQVKAEQQLSPTGRAKNAGSRIFS